MRAIVVVLALALAFPALASAQEQAQCANNLPCGAVPWRLPVLPRLATPTPMPTQRPPQTSNNPDQNFNPGPTPTPIAYQPGQLDVSQLNGQLATISAMANATPVSISQANGSFATPSTSALGSQAGVFFGYARGLQTYNFGVITPLLVFFLSGFLLVLSIKVATLLLPVIMTVVGLIRKLIALILEFIPL